MINSENYNRFEYLYAIDYKGLRLRIFKLKYFPGIRVTKEYTLSNTSKTTIHMALYYDQKRAAQL